MNKKILVVCLTPFIFGMNTGFSASAPVNMGDQASQVPENTQGNVNQNAQQNPTYEQGADQGNLPNTQQNVVPIYDGASVPENLQAPMASAIDPNAVLPSPVLNPVVQPVEQPAPVPENQAIAQPQVPVEPAVQPIVQPVPVPENQAIVQPQVPVEPAVQPIVQAAPVPENQVIAQPQVPVQTEPVTCYIRSTAGEFNDMSTRVNTVADAVSNVATQVSALATAVDQTNQRLNNLENLANNAARADVPQPQVVPQEIVAPQNPAEIPQAPVVNNQVIVPEQVPVTNQVEIPQAPVENNQVIAPEQVPVVNQAEISQAAPEMAQQMVSLTPETQAYIDAKVTESVRNAVKLIKNEEASASKKNLEEGVSKIDLSENDVTTEEPKTESITSAN